MNNKLDTIPAWIDISRTLGVCLGIFLFVLLRTVFKDDQDVHEEAHRFYQFLNQFAWYSLSVLLVLPWRLVCLSFAWEILYLLLIISSSVVLFVMVPGVAWAYMHGALRSYEFLLIVLCFGCLILQFKAIWKLKKFAEKTI